MPDNFAPYGQTRKEYLATISRCVRQWNEERFRYAFKVLAKKMKEKGIFKCQTK